MQTNLAFLKLFILTLVLAFGFGLSETFAQTCPTSNGIEILVSPDPTINIGGGISICEGGSATLTATVGDGSGTCTIQWQSRVGAGAWTDIAGANATTYNAVALTVTTDYRATYTCTHDGCDPATSNTETITVLPDPTVTIAVDNPSVCIDGAVTLSSTVSGGSGTVSYQWQSSADGTTYADISGATAATYDPSTSAVGVTYYQLVVNYSDNGCTEVTSSPLTVTVLEDPNATIAVNNPEVCIGGAVTLSSTVTGGSGTISYQWDSSPDGTTWTPIGGATASTYDPPTATAGVVYYQVRVNYTNGGCDEATSNNLTVTVIEDPVVTITGDGTIICEGGSHTLTSSVTGGSGSPTYQWQDSPDGTTWTDISGATATSFTTPALATTTQYRLIVTFPNSGCDVATSSAATITVVPEPSISITGGLTICEGGSTTLTATVGNGTGTCDIQWQYLSGATWTDIAGETATTYTTPNLTETTLYRAQYNCDGNSCAEATSNTETVEVVNDPNVNIAGGEVTICTGGNVVLTASVTGGTGTVSYQWQSSTDNVTFTDISGATAATLNTGSLTQTTYYVVNVVFTGNGCDNTGSGSSSVIVVDDPTASIAGPAEICTGGTTTLTATTSGGTGTCTIQWQTNALGFWQNISGATAATYTTPALTANTSYRIRYTCTGGGCDQATSNQIDVVVLPDPVATIVVDNPEVCVGGSVLLTSSYVDGSGVPTYQWQSSADGTTWADVSGATASTYTAPTATVGVTYYQVLITFPNGGCDVATSNNLTVTVLPDPSVTIVVDNPEVCIGGSVLLTATPADGSGTVSYQWQSSAASGGPWTDVGGATASTYTAPTTTAGVVYYQVLVNYSNSGCDEATSNELSVTVIEDPTVTIEVDNPEVCIGAGVQLSITAQAGGSGTVSYQWQSSADGTTWADVSGATANTYTPPTTTAGVTYYQLLVNYDNSGCDEATSNAITVTVIEDPVVTIEVDNPEVCIGGAVELSIQSQSGGSGTPTYQWQSSADGTTWANVSGATSNTYTAPTTAAGVTYYQLLTTYSNGGCDVSTSNNLTVTVIEDPTANITVDNPEVCIGGSVTLTAATTGGSGLVSYQWQSSPDGTTWTDISGATAFVYNAPTTTAGVVYYQILVNFANSGCDQATSNNLTVTVIEDPTATISVDNPSVCEGGAAQLSVATTGGSGTVSYQWQSSASSGGPWTDVAGATNSTYDAPTGTPGVVYYQVLVTYANSGCDLATSNELSVTVIADPTVTVSGGDITICDGGDATLTTTVTGGQGNISYQWQSSTDGTTYTDIAGATAVTYDVVDLTTTTYYQVVIAFDGSGCNGATSTAVLITVVPDPVITIAGDNAVCVGGSVQLNASVSGGTGTCVLQWQESSTGAAPWSDIAGENGTSFQTPALNGNQHYRAIYTCTGSGCCD